MKTKINIFLIFCLAFSSTYAQSEDAYWCVGVGYQLSSAKVKSDLGTSHLDDYNHLVARLDVVDYSTGITGYADGSLLIALATQPGFKGISAMGPILEMGYGWAVNNNKPIKISDAVEAKITLGFGLGYRGFTTPPNYKEIEGGVIFSPELGSIISIGERIVLAPKLGYSPLLNQGIIGSRTVLEVHALLKALPWLGFSITPSLENFHFKETEEVPEYSVKFSSTRFGLALIF